MGDYINELNELNELSTDVREELNDWLALRRLERQVTLTIPVGDDDLGRRLFALEASGDAVRTRVRHWFFWTRDAYQLSDTGRQKLASKRQELEDVHDEIGKAIATAADALAERGIHPGVLLLERMILLHERFDREESGFFTRCERLAAHVRTFSATGHDDSDGGELIALLALHQ